MELAKIPKLESVGNALAQYAKALHSAGHFEQKGRRSVLNPNFVTFTIQTARAKNIVLSLRGNPQEFEVHSGLPLKPDRNGYSSCTITSPKYLKDAAVNIERAHELWNRSRSREAKTPVIA
jgi:hypothetical protein